MPRRYQHMFDVYRLQRILGIPHPDGVAALPAHYADYVIMFDHTERSAEAERQANQQAGG